MRPRGSPGLAPSERISLLTLLKSWSLSRQTETLVIGNMASLIISCEQRSHVCKKCLFSNQFFSPRPRRFSQASLFIIIVGNPCVQNWREEPLVATILAFVNGEKRNFSQAVSQERCFQVHCVRASVRKVLLAGLGLLQTVIFGEK